MLCEVVFPIARGISNLSLPRNCIMNFAFLSALIAISSFVNFLDRRRALVL